MLLRCCRCLLISTVAHELRVIWHESKVDRDSQQRETHKLQYKQTFRVGELVCRDKEYSEENCTLLTVNKSYVLPITNILIGVRLLLLRIMSSTYINSKHLRHSFKIYDIFYKICPRGFSEFVLAGVSILVGRNVLAGVSILVTQIDVNSWCKYANTHMTLYHYKNVHVNQLI